MKVWKIEYHQNDSPSGWVFEWFATKAEAQLRHNELNADLEGEGVANLKEPEPFNVPETKAALVSFLNAYAANGLSG